MFNPNPCNSFNNTLNDSEEYFLLLIILNKLPKKIKIGIRMAINEEAQSSYYTSRMGIRLNEILDFFNDSRSQFIHFGTHTSNFKWMSQLIQTLSNLKLNFA